MQQVIPLGRKTADVCESVRENNPGGGYTTRSVKRGQVSAEIELVIDPAKVPFYKFQRVLLSKAGRSVTNGGLVVIRVKQGTKTTEPA